MTMTPSQIAGLTIILSFLLSSGASAIYVKSAWPPLDPVEESSEESSPHSPNTKHNVPQLPDQPEITETKIPERDEPEEMIAPAAREDPELAKRVKSYCAWSTPCKWTVCPWTRRLWKFGQSARCYNVASGCQCAPQEPCTMNPMVNHGTAKNTASWFCRARPRDYHKRYEHFSPPASERLGRFVVYRRYK